MGESTKSGVSWDEGATLLLFRFVSSALSGSGNPFVDEEDSKHNDDDDVLNFARNEHS